jgi:hypothetical protein
MDGIPPAPMPFIGVGILKSERAGLKWWAEKYADNGTYCLKHKIIVGRPLPS